MTLPKQTFIYNLISISTEGRKIDTIIGSDLGILKTEDSNSRTITSTRRLIGHNSKALMLIVVGVVHREDTTEGNMEGDLCQEVEIEATINTTIIHPEAIFILLC